MSSGPNRAFARERARRWVVVKTETTNRESMVAGIVDELRRQFPAPVFRVQPRRFAMGSKRCPFWHWAVRVYQVQKEATP